MSQEEGQYLPLATDGTILHVVSLPTPLSPPNWKCAYPGFSTCLEPEFSAGRISSASQYRTVECHWGGATCPGFDSVATESQPYCDGPYTTLCPLSEGDEYGQFESFDFPSTGERHAAGRAPSRGQEVRFRRGQMDRLARLAGALERRGRRLQVLLLLSI